MSPAAGTHPLPAGYVFNVTSGTDTLQTCCKWNEYGYYDASSGLPECCTTGGCRVSAPQGAAVINWCCAEYAGSTAPSQLPAACGGTSIDPPLCKLPAMIADQFDFARQKCCPSTERETSHAPPCRFAALLSALPASVKPPAEVNVRWCLLQQPCNLL